MASKLPKDPALKKFISDLIRKDAANNDGEVTLSIRQIRAALSDHFGVDDDTLKQNKKDLIKSAAQDTINAIADEKVNATEQEEEDDRAGTSDEQGEAESKSPSPAASEMSELDDTDPEEAATSRSKKSSSKESKSSTSSSSVQRGTKGEAKKPRTSSSSSKSSDKADEEVTRLKKFVTACGVRKQWKNWFASQSPVADKPQLQAKALRTLLGELGMEGRLSMHKAKKIKEKREFEEEMKAIGADIPAGDVDRARGKRRASSGSQRKASRAETSSTEDDGHDQEQSGDEDTGSDADLEEVRPPKKTKFNASLAAFAAELNSDDE
ncbi:unnamed protein product [Sympodiomycopsis kandeliae]